MSVYLLHFGSEDENTPYKHARHYLGFAGRGETDQASVEARLKEHKSGRGAALTRAAQAVGIKFTLARIWKGADKNDEWKLRSRKQNTKLCPICNPDAYKLATNI